MNERYTTKPFTTNIPKNTRKTYKKVLKFVKPVVKYRPKSLIYKEYASDSKIRCLYGRAGSSPAFGTIYVDLID